MSVALRRALQVIWLWALNMPSYLLFVDELRIDVTSLQPSGIGN